MSVTKERIVDIIDEMIKEVEKDKIEGGEQALLYMCIIDKFLELRNRIERRIKE